MKIAVVGATGAVGKQLLPLLGERKFPFKELKAFGSARSEGKTLFFKNQSSQQEIQCEKLSPGCFEGVKIAFFDASDAVSAEWVPQAIAAGAWVIDNSGHFRMDLDVPLVVPEINGDLIRSSVSRKLIAGPNCSTVQIALALKPIADRWGLKRIVASTYQSVSGAGMAAIEELKAQALAALNGSEVPLPRAFPHPIAFNCIPQIGGFNKNGNTSEESKIVAETRKILSLASLKISATAIRVPTLSCHGASINIECERPFQLSDVREALTRQPGVIVQDDPERGCYPMGFSGAGQDAVYVGRMRSDDSVDYGLNLWVVSDNLRKGAALNAIQIGEVLLEQIH